MFTRCGSDIADIRKAVGKTALIPQQVEYLLPFINQVYIIAYLESTYLLGKGFNQAHNTMSCIYPCICRDKRVDRVRLIWQGRSEKFWGWILLGLRRERGLNFFRIPKVLDFFNDVNMG